MLDYRNHLKTILNQTAGDEQSLKNSLNAIKSILMMAENDQKESEPKVNPKQAVNKSKKQDIKKFILNLASFMQMPDDQKLKKDTLSSLHQLLFNQKIGQNYGSELGKLDQAIKNAKTSEMAKQAKVFQQALAPRASFKVKKHAFTVIRLTRGADLLDQNGQVAYSVSEKQIHGLNLKSGDQVSLAVDAKADFVEIKKIVGFKKLRQRDYRPISVFKFAVVEGRKDHLFIEKNIDQQKLPLGKLPLAYYNQADLKLEPGSIVDLAWYQADPLLKKDPDRAIDIRWVYQTDLPKKSQLKVKKTTSGTATLALSNLAMDLTGKKVGIAIGDKQNGDIFQKIVTHYHGQSIMIDAFNKRKKQIEKKVQNLDLLVLVTAYAAHSATWNLEEFASKYQVNFAVSSSKGYQAFERALYRAFHHLPAYEGSGIIIYQKK